MSLRAHVAAVFAALPRFAAEVSILAGGSLRAYYDGTEVKDYDLFFRDRHDYRTAYTAMEIAGFEFLGTRGGSETWLSPCGKEFNLVSLAFGSPEEHVSRFDFRCCQMAAWIEVNSVGAPMTQVIKAQRAVYDCRKKRLRLVNNNGTERTAKRIEHYEADYGYALSGLRRCPVNRPARIRRYVASRPVSRRGGY